MSILTIINKKIKLYIKNIAETYNLNEEELWTIWSQESNTNTNTNIKTVEEDIDGELSTFNLQKCLRKDLQDMCKKRSMKISGTKAALIALLQGESKQEKLSNTIKQTEPAVINKIKESIPVIAIRRNNWGNLEHAETSFVFDKKKKVIGRQNQEDGTIDNLNKDDINICNKYKFAYVLPENLDNNKNSLEDIKIDELDDYDCSDEEEEIQEDDQEDDHQEEDHQEDDHQEEDIQEEDLLEKDDDDDDDEDDDEDDEDEDEEDEYE
jgi:hypothetical protein